MIVCLFSSFYRSTEIKTTVDKIIREDHDDRDEAAEETWSLGVSAIAAVMSSSTPGRDCSSFGTFSMWDVENANGSDSGLQPASFLVCTRIMYFVCGCSPLMLYSKSADDEREEISVGEAEDSKAEESLASSPVTSSSLILR